MHQIVAKSTPESSKTNNSVEAKNGGINTIQIFKFNHTSTNIKTYNYASWHQKCQNIDVHKVRRPCGWLVFANAGNNRYVLARISSVSTWRKKQKEKKYVKSAAKANLQIEPW